MDIFVLLLITILVYLLPLNNDYLGVKSTTGLKGFMALGIVLHHISKWVTTGEEFSNFGYMGTYIVSVFFFLSGYGLYIQNEQKENYLKKFLMKRLSKILIPFLIITILHLIYRNVRHGQELSFRYFIDLLKNGETVIYNGWFIDIIILMYIFFYISFRVFSNKTMAILVNTIFVIFYIVLAIKLGYGFWWYNNSLPFVLGLIWAKNKNYIDEILNKYYFSILVCTTGLLFISHQYNFILKKLHLVDIYSYVLVTNLDNVIFTIFSVLIIRKINFSNKYLLHLGNISFELYMIHGMIMAILGDYFATSRINDVIFTVLVLIVSIFLAWLLNSVIKKINIKTT